MENEHFFSVEIVGNRPPAAGKGRPKGSLNKTTSAIRRLSTRLFDKPYWEAIKARLITGKVAPAVEVRLLAYAYGEPTKVLSLEGAVTVEDKRSVLAQLPDDVVRNLLAQEAFEDTDSTERVN